MIARRLFLGSAAAFAGVGVSEGLFAAPTSFVMWHSPGCGCCLEWRKRIEASFKRRLPIVEVADMAQVKRAQGVPAPLHSCHTALINGYVVEGHVPPADIQRLIRSRSTLVKGLAVPGMPAGSPGMDVGHNQKEPYKVIAFGKGGRQSVFASYA